MRVEPGHFQVMRIRIAKTMLIIMALSGLMTPHAYAHDLAEITESHVLAFDAQHNSDTDSVSCDHCCHFFSHSVGMIPAISFSMSNQIKEIPVFQEQDFPSIIGPPPKQPPIA